MGRKHEAETQVTRRAVGRCSSPAPNETGEAGPLYGLPGQGPAGRAGSRRQPVRAGFFPTSLPPSLAPVRCRGEFLSFGKREDPVLTTLVRRADGFAGRSGEEAAVALWAPRRGFEQGVVSSCVPHGTGSCQTEPAGASWPSLPGTELTGQRRGDEPHARPLDPPGASLAWRGSPAHVWKAACPFLVSSERDSAELGASSAVPCFFSARCPGSPSHNLFS